jgi:hypothetical protein
MKNFIKDNNLNGYKLLAIVALFVLIFINIINISQPILEEHGFRQTQTALTAYYLGINGFSLSYQTPVVGEPWAIPFEFPIYQQIVAVISSYTSVSLTVIGRLINLLFIIMACIPIICILRRNKIHESAIYIVISLYLSAPLYLFWAGTFMIEGAALFFTLCFLYYSIKVNHKDLSVKDLTFLGLFLLLAGLQKITTVLPVVLIVLVYSTINWLGLNSFSIKHRLSTLLRIYLMIFLALGVAIIWVRYSDIIKLENPIGAKLTSKALRSWNFGTLAQRMSAEFWLNIVFYRNIWASSLGYFGVVVITIGLGLIKTPSRVKLMIAISLILFVLPFLFFPNLHAVHNYYQVSNLVFFVIALGLSLFYLLDRSISISKYVLPILVITFMGWNYYSFSKEYFPKKMMDLSDHRTLKLGKFIDENTPIDATVIWLGGYDWSSEVAFYSKRKSLTVPPWSGFELDAINHTNRFLSSTPTAITLCPSPNFKDMVSAMSVNYPTAKYADVSGCRIYKISSN